MTDLARMKRLNEIGLLTTMLIAMLSFVSCSKVIIVPDANQQEISVIPVVEVPSKIVTGPQSGAFPKEETIGVFAYQSTTEPGIAWPTDLEESPYFPRTEFIYKDGAQAWGAADPKYWPDGGSLIFAGYSPYKRPKTNATGGHYLEEVGMSYDFAAKALKIDNYTVCQYIPMTQEQIQDDEPYVNVAQSDLSFFLPKLDDEGNYVGVNHLGSNPALFHHALALVEFNVVAEDLDAINRVDLSKITLKNVFHKGSMTATALPGGEVWVDWGTSLSNAYDVDVFHAKEPDPEKPEEYVGGLELFLQPRTIAQLMIIPGVTHNIEIIYYVMVNEKYYEQRAVYTPEQLNLLKWEAGKKYVYNIVLGVDRMWFSPLTLEWEE